MPEREERIAAATLAFMNVAILGYALLRLYSFLKGEPDPRSVGPSTHIAFFWRSATACWWGSMAAAGAWRYPQVRGTLGKALPWILLLATVLAVLVP